MDVCKRLSVPTVATLALAGTVACAGPGVTPEADSFYDNPYIEELAEAVGPLRLFEPRLSGGFKWAECGEAQVHRDPVELIPSALCGSLTPGAPERDRVLGVWTRTQQALDRGESAELLHAQGVGHLLWSTERDEKSARTLHWAIEDLTEAKELSAEGSEQQTAILNDLAVAYRLQTERSGGVLDLLASLEAVEEAYRAGSREPEALFNRALLLDELALQRVSESAWAEYLAARDQGPWRLEGERRAQRAPVYTLREEWQRIEGDLMRAALAGDQEALQPIVASAPMLVWSFAQNIWLPQWADSFLAGDGGLDEPLVLAREVGRALDALGLDRSVHDAVSVLAEAASEPSRLHSLAAGHSAYGRGYRIEGGREDGDVCETYQRAEQSLEAGRSPFALWAGLSAVQGCFERIDRRTALAKLDELSRRAAPGRYPALTGRIDWMRALGAASQGRFEEALAHGLKAQAELERAQDRDLPSVLAVVSDGYRSLGSLEESWRARLRSLQSFSSFDHLAGYHNALTSGIFALFHGHQFLAAGPLTEELVLVADELGDPEHQAYAAALRARFLSETGQQVQAGEALDAGDRFVDGIQRPDRRRQVDADLSLTRAQVEVELDPRRAEASATKAFEVLTSAGRQGRLPELHLLQARAHAALGDIETAEGHFRLAFDELERRRGLSLKEENRISFFEMFQDSIDEILGFYVDRNKSAEAFLYAERSRSRALMDWVVRGAAPGAEALTRVSRAFPEAWSLPELQRSLPPGEVVLEFAVLPDRLVTWVVRRDFQHMVVREIPAQELLRQVTRFRGLLESFASDDEVVSAAEELYEELIEPVTGFLTEGDRLLVAPDRFLHRIPFAALHSKARGAFLVESHPVAVIPSTSLLSVERARGPWPAAPERMTALAVAPRTDGQPALPWAQREARDVAGLFPRASLLIGDAATEQAVLGLLPQYEIIHFATHAEYREAAPMLSSISLAPSGNGDDGRLTAQEIYGLDLGGTQLVVLAACQTTDGYPGTGREGIGGWARALFAAGVPRVVAALWELEDQTSHEMMEQLYRHLLTRSPADALRAAQRERIRSDEPPSAWAQHQVYGDF